MGEFMFSLCVKNSSVSWRFLGDRICWNLSWHASDGSNQPTFQRPALSPSLGFWCSRRTRSLKQWLIWTIWFGCQPEKVLQNI